MRKPAQDSRSLKAFFVYGGIVLFFVLLSLLIKTAFIIKASKFDGTHQFIVAVSQNNKLKEIIKFNPSAQEISILQLNGENVEIIPDAKVNSSFELPSGDNAAKTMREIGLRYNSIETNLTLFDIGRLIIFSYKTQQPQIIKENVTNNFFVDEAITSDNLSIQIINASGVSGMGKRLENVLSNLGSSVIAVTTSNKEEKLSKIQYFGEASYTLNKFKNILNLPLEKIEREEIADIIIIIGKDYRSINNF